MVETPNNLPPADAGDVLADDHAGANRPARSVGEPFEIAVLPLLNTTLFPGTVVPLAAGRARSVAAVEAALGHPEKLLACVSVRPNKVTEEEALPADMYEVGTLVMIKRMFRGDDALQIIVQGTERVRVVEWTQEDPHLRAKVRILAPLETEDAEEVEALKRNVQT
ncbi:MAG: LON peptidase substrate-binding domain-containing protein, partial [Acidobacteria bacterium]|nr:LON peptidase substrate-binding domain-containing protein [Acidobacteriota bacterium]